MLHVKQELFLKLPEKKRNEGEMNFQKKQCFSVSKQDHPPLPQPPTIKVDFKF